MKFSDLTYKIVAYSEIENFNSDDCIDWAYEMLVLEHSSENLLILAGISKPTHYFEVKEYLKKALNELNIKTLEKEEAILSYSTYYIKKIAESENIEQNLKLIHTFCQNNDDNENIFDFSLLYWAWDDFKFGEEFTHYWENANRHNINQIIIETAKKWLTKNEKEIELITN
ncbi:hypothetical protein [Flavobacterium branchiophilum]|uniref:Uncharacterized protein n=1 Tax=Flavobacterium branchiophilum TaxID=55197 RepID=A0A2H3KEH8_9FLAO|nr:hypothetical protein [Flavobacterium branchiophilum]PDS25229.1 hypothetical protein B0A77_05175 [Flavobacterium branchiophilum]